MREKFEAWYLEMMKELCPWAKDNTVDSIRKLRGEDGDYAGYAFIKGCWLGYQQQHIPEGYKLVPIKPTREMIGQVHPVTSGTCMNCGCDVQADCEQNVLWSWDDMLAAAPEQKQ